MQFDTAVRVPRFARFVAAKENRQDFFVDSPTRCSRDEEESTQPKAVEGLGTI